MVPETVILECKKNNERAQKLIFDQYSKIMMTICIRYLKQWEDAEECMLSGFQKFFASIHLYNYSNEAGLTAYIKKIMVNECLMHLRKRQYPFTNINDDCIIENANENIFNKLSADELLNIILKLPTGYRTVFNLSIIEDYSHKEIAGILNISEGTSKSQLSKARQMLQKMITKNER